MQILHVVGRSHRRGAEQVAMELAAELDALGHADEVVAIGPGHEGESVSELPALTGSTRHRPWTLVRAGLALRSRLRGRRPDLVVAHGAAAAVVAAVASPRRPPHIVWQTIMGMAARSFRGPDRVLWKVVGRRLDAVVALTDEMGEEARRLGFAGPIWPLPNGRSTVRFDHLDRAVAGSELRAERAIADGAPVLGFVGYLVDQKRPVLAIEVFAEVSRALPEAHLVLVGAGPLADAVAARADALGPRERIHLLGHRDDVPEVLAGVDALLLCSEDEGVPGIVIEAAMAGCPVVTVRVGGVTDVVVDGETGVVVDSHEPADLASACVSVLDDLDLAAALSIGARARSAEFSMGAIARRYATHFDSLRDGCVADDHVE